MYRHCANLWLAHHTPAVADEKYFYHCFISPCFALKRPALLGFSGVLLNALKLQIVANQSRICC